MQLPFRISLATAVAFAFLAGLAGLLPAAAAARLSLNETARVLAGLQPPPDAVGEPTLPKSQAYVRESAGGWTGYERRIGGPLREWARTALERMPGETVFYPFSGPDFPTVDQLYPDAGRYVLVAIQPAGPPPAFDRYAPADRASFFAQFRHAWAQYAHLGFFRTDDLDNEARKSGIRVGVTAQLMAFAARLGYEVVGVDPIRLSAVATDLEPHPGRRADDRTWECVRLSLMKDGREVQLDYVRLDISDRGLARDRAGAAWIERMAGHRTVLKAASHLPQKPYFSVLRNALLARAPSIWQDETGIEYSQLADAFSVTLYGAFTRAHQRFSADSQRSLALAYKRSGGVDPLPFVIGYKKESGSSVQVAVRSSGLAGERRARTVARAQKATADRDIRSLQSVVAARLADYAQRPRKLFLGGSPGEPVHAEYVASVKSHIARLLASAGMSPQRPAVLSLTLASDGSLNAADVERSSGNPTFDRRIRALLRQAAPFPHWPDAMRAGADLLVITLHLPGT